MTHATKSPGVKLTLDKDLFNHLIGILDLNIRVNVEDEKFSLTASNLKSKLLKYSVPRVNEDDIEYVDVRFFPNEASDMIWQLLSQIEIDKNAENYYLTLINNRNKE